MSSVPRVRIAPTLETMSAMYRLSRHGGPGSPRFRAYIARVEHEWGLVAYNPMAGEAAQRAVDLLIGMDAESLAATAAASALDACAYEGEITLAVAVRSSGMWTDRLATELELRAAPVDAPAGHGIVTLWAKDELSSAALRNESIAEAVRVISAALHGQPRTLREFLWRDGLAYALADVLCGVDRCADADGPEVWRLTRADSERTGRAIDVFGDSDDFRDISTVLFGDPICDSMGWPTLDVPQNGGYAWAVRHARQRLLEMGAAAAVRQRSLQRQATPA